MSESNSISIKKAIKDNIQSNLYLLPGIQRKFVWKTEQIEMLFDSLMQGYPINTFMLWKVTAPEIRKNYKFYRFLNNYVEKFKEDNEEVSNNLLNETFWAVIDGQQRLTSLYIGLSGTYRYKMPNKWYIDNEKNMPTRRLYLNLTGPAKDDADENKLYDFKFKTEQEVKEDVEGHWFLVGRILDCEDLPAVSRMLTEKGLSGNDFAMNALTTLFSKISLEKLISFHEIDEQDQDKVLNIFIRTNSGGTQLSFSDLLTSMTAASWEKYDIRKELSEVRREIRGFGPSKDKFEVSQDLILKAMLVLTPDCDVRFKIRNFNKSNIEKFEEDWPENKKSIVTTFELLEQLGFSDSMLRAKNAIIPIAYYIKQRNLADEIIKTTYSASDKAKIAKWLNLSLVKKIFGGQSDTVLRNLREVLDENPTGEFPLAQIVKKFRGGAKNYALDDDVIEGLLTAEYRTPMANLVLGLLYPQVLAEHGKAIAQDHMHPKTEFEDAEKFEKIKFKEEAGEDVKKLAQETYNTVLNLQLLDGGRNSSKNDDDLEAWAERKGWKEDDLLIEKGVSLKIEDYKEFIESRQKIMTEYLKNVVEI